MAAAVREVRREVKKAALVPSVVDAAAVTLLANVVFRVVELPFSTSVSLGGLPGVDPGTTVHVAVPIALALGILVAVVEYTVRMWQPPVAQFERANPPVAEALRTARDTISTDGTSAMAVALYDDVLTRLKSTSSVELLPTRRVAVTLVFALLLSVASIHVAIEDIQINVPGGQQNGNGSDLDAQDRPTELQNGSAILGDPENVTAGSEELNATLSGVAGSGDGPSSSAAAYDSSGFGGESGVESQRAGYLEDDTLEEAELIRNYTLKIRDQDDE
ncbi:hypothetical protein GJR98_11760 [Haloferax sp. MBLA0077]|uniref:Uncharacterized protein n=3 Tax=Haloferacaceae TaxID=1644056 RepID=A0A6G1Z4F5_9EURY|nr:hypothetical protein Hfx1149_11775 [Haloferax sp. CBA1149]MRW81383.1 hypothetical protein [Haloferax marinisediminis]